MSTRKPMYTNLLLSALLSSCSTPAPSSCSIASLISVPLMCCCAEKTRLSAPQVKMAGTDSGGGVFKGPKGGVEQAYTVVAHFNFVEQEGEDKEAIPTGLKVCRIMHEPECWCMYHQDFLYGCISSSRACQTSWDNFVSDNTATVAKRVGYSGHIVTVWAPQSLWV